MGLVLVCDRRGAVCDVCGAIGMTDKELLEMAAKAAGIDLGDWSNAEDGFIRYHFITRHIWNPLTDDGDALRLAVKLGLYVNVYPAPESKTTTGVFADSLTRESHGVDPCAATRRAITRAAAAIGKATP